MTEKDIRSEITRIIHTTDDRTPPEWIVHQVALNHKSQVQLDDDFEVFSQLCIIGFVRAIVRAVIQNNRIRAKDGDMQMLLPGWKRLQQRYIIYSKTTKAWEVVPILKLRYWEAKSKATEIRRDAVGGIEHADELNRFAEEVLKPKEEGESKAG